jgi:hypothetical protein
MKIKSPVFEEGGLMPSKYTCDGEGVNPPFEISGVPENTKSLALIADDPDSSSGNWIHWMVWNIDPKIKEIAENSVPAVAIEGINGFGKIGYGGPCPRSGSHHYRFKLYALSDTFEFPAKIKREEMEKNIADYILDQTMIVGIYKKIIINQ